MNWRLVTKEEDEQGLKHLALYTEQSDKKSTMRVSSKECDHLNNQHIVSHKQCSKFVGSVLLQAYKMGY